MLSAGKLLNGVLVRLEPNCSLVIKTSTPTEPVVVSVLTAFSLGSMRGTKAAVRKLFLCSSKFFYRKIPGSKFRMFLNQLLLHMTKV